MLKRIVHANGFYGNFRSRCRSDYTQEYRKAAQPQPPDLFLKRMKETPSKHIFSKHDNRHAFPGSATYFESGLGRRRIDGSLPSTQNLIDWMPLKEELQRERPLVSSYQSDFRSTEKPPQLLVHHAHLEKRPLQRTPSTTYQHTYRSYYLCEPSLRVLKSHQLIKEDKPKEPESAPATSSEPTAPIHSKSSAPASSEPTATDANATAEALAPGPTYGHSVPYKTPRWTVSDCLNWNNC
ncbi:ciliary microtubule inner protein 7 [Pogona vitticeps]